MRCRILPRPIFQFGFDAETVFLQNHHNLETDGCVLRVQDVMTQNRALLNIGLIANVAQAVGVGKEVAMYPCVLGLEGVCLVIGTKNLTHIKEGFKGYKNWQN
jgi:hypothetical protein